MKKILAGLGLAVIAAHASATYTISISAVGADVVATGRGTINTTDMTIQTIESSCGGGKGGTDANITICMGVGAAGGVAVDAVSNTTPFGTGLVTLASSASGDPVFMSGPQLYLPANYVSGAPLTSSNTYAGTTLAAMGLTAGTYTYNLRSGDKLVLQIGTVAAPTPVPGLGAWAVVALSALLAMLGLARRRKHQA